MQDGTEADLKGTVADYERTIFRLAVLEHMARHASDEEVRRVVCTCCGHWNAIYRFDGDCWRCQMLVMDWNGSPTICHQYWPRMNLRDHPDNPPPDLEEAQPPYPWPVDIYYHHNQLWQKMELAILKKAGEKK